MLKSPLSLTQEPEQTSLLFPAGIQLLFTEQATHEPLLPPGGQPTTTQVLNP